MILRSLLSLALTGVVGTAKATSTCQSLAVDFENLSHHIQKELGLHEYHAPVLVGYSSGATIVYATLAQAPSGTFAGAISMGFCPRASRCSPSC